MAWDWQQVVAIACVAGAVCLLGLRVRRWWKGGAEAGCGSGCSTCPAKDSIVSANTMNVHTKPLVALDLRRVEKSRE